MKGLIHWLIISLTLEITVNGVAVRQDDLLVEKASDCANKPGTDKLDLIFLVDGSTSIGNSNFTKILMFVSEVIKHLDLAENRSRVGIVQFNGREKTELHLNSIYSKTEVLDFVQHRISYLTGVTLTGKAIRYVMSKEFTLDTGDRPTVPNVLVVITDGRAQDDVEVAAQNAWSAGVEVYAIGVTNLIDPDQLLEIANFRKDHVFHVEDFENFTKVIESLTIQFSSEHRCNLIPNTTAVPIGTTVQPSPVGTVATTVAPKLTGEVRVECGENGIKVIKPTEKSFKGNVYVKGHFDDPKCKIEYENQTDVLLPSISINIHDCGAERKRSANPRGVYISTTVVFMFHKVFNTKKDSAYNIRCFYMEADKSVSQEIDVSMLTTQGTLSEQADMPACEYSLRSNSESGPIIKFAQIGMPVYHRWECEPPPNTAGIFGMKVHSCVAKGSQGNQVNILDSNGCPLDNFVMPQLVYSENLLMAHVSTMVFKFADDQSIYFDCQISICLKAAGTCTGVTPPKCDSSKGKRSADNKKMFSRNFLGDDIIDVQSYRLDVFEIPDSTDSLSDPRNEVSPSVNQERKASDPQGVCLSTRSLVLITSCVVLMLTTAISVLGLLVFLRKRKETH